MAEDQLHNDIKRLKLLIAEDKIGYVFEYLTRHLRDTETDLFNELILLYTEYNTLQRKINAGIMNSDQVKIENNQIVNRFLNLIDHVNSLQPPGAQEQEEHPPVTSLGAYNRIKEETTQANSFVGKTIGNYKIGEYINSGGFGRVHKAVNFMTDEEVAIKISKPLNVSELYLNDIVNFGKKILKLPEHQHIVKTRHIGHGNLLNEDRIYYVMDYVEGGDLYQLINKSFEEVSIGERLRIFREVCEGIDFAHKVELTNSFGNQEIGIIHGDIKPSNILLTRERQAKIGDFLLVDFYLIMEEDKEIKYRVLQRSPPTTVIGTRAYMAPEQMATGNINKKTDIYALGVLLFEILTGKKVSFSASKSYIEERIGQLDTDKKEIIFQVIYKCLSLKPEARYNDAREILLELDPGEKTNNWFSKLFGK